MVDLNIIKRIAEVEFADIVEISFTIDYKLRIILKDKSFIDVNLSKKLLGKFGFHWECQGDEIYRYDNFPDKKCRKLSTYPYHFHKNSKENIQSSPFSLSSIEGFRDFMKFVRSKLAC